MHRQRSIHVHVWNQRSFDRILRQATDRLGLGLQVVDRATSSEATGCMVYVLERTAT